MSEKSISEFVPKFSNTYSVTESGNTLIVPLKKAFDVLDVNKGDNVRVVCDEDKIIIFPEMGLLDKTVLSISLGKD